MLERSFTANQGDSQRSLRVIHLITSLSRGGAEHMLYKLLSSLDRDRIEPVVISLVPGGVYAEKIADLGIPVHTLNWRRVWASPLALIRLARLVARIGPDIIHAWMYHAALAGLLSAPRRPMIIAIRQAMHGLAHEKPMTRLVIRALGQLSGKALAICYNARLSRTQHEGFGFAAKSSLVIPNGFDTELLKPDREQGTEIRKSLGLRTDQFVVLHLARLHPVKDHAAMLSAAQSLLPNPRFVFVLAGTGVTAAHPLFAHLDPDRFRLLGDRDDVPALLKAADLLCLSSIWGEAFPNVVGEAMASGVPCIATDIGDSAFVVGDTGMIVPPGDPEALAKAISHMAGLAAHERADLGARARQRIVENFSLAKVAHDYMDLYDAVLAKTSQRAA